MYHDIPALLRLLIHAVVCAVIIYRSFARTHMEGDRELRYSYAHCAPQLMDDAFRAITGEAARTTG